MKKKTEIDFDNLNLDPEERELYDAIERGEFKSVSIQEKKRFSSVLKGALKKDKRVNIRMSQVDIDLLKQRAFEEGIPYQTLISSILHKYLIGRLIESK